MPNFKLGKRPVVRDPRTLRLENYLVAGQLPTPPASRAWDDGINSWGMALNDSLGDCVIAAQAHAETVVTANAAGVANAVTVPDSAVLIGYEQVGGYVPGNPSTDNGCDMLTAVKWWQSTGIGGHKISAFVSCPMTQPMIETTIDLFALAYIGFQFPQSAMQQFDAGQPWTVVPGSPIVGGHAIDLVDYDATYVTCITWGKLQKIAWSFLAAYMDEAYAVITPEWLEANGNSPSGLNWTALQADLAQVGGQPAPTPVSTTTTLSSSASSLAIGQSFSLQATVAGASPTGLVTFTDNGQMLGTGGLTNGVTTLNPTAYTAAGSHAFTASYGGDANNAASTSPTVTVVVASPSPAPTPVWTPNAYVTSWLTWQQQVANYVVTTYAAGDVKSTQTWQAELNQYEAGIESLVAAQTHSLPDSLPGVPQ